MKNNLYISKIEDALYSYVHIKEKMKNDLLDITDLEKEKANERSKDIVYKSVSGGSYVSPEEIVQIKISRISAKVAEAARQIRRVESALGAIEGDGYSKIIELKYFQRVKNEAIAEIMNCDISTVRRNRLRLLSLMAVSMFGSDAMFAVEYC